jgi:hypothetical protein
LPGITTVATLAVFAGQPASVLLAVGGLTLGAITIARGVVWPRRSVRAA